MELTEANLLGELMAASHLAMTIGPYLFACVFILTTHMLVPL
jgi:hypothetical protein